MGACRELDDSTPRPLSFPYANLCLYLCLTTCINGTVWVRMFIHLFIELGFLGYIWVPTDFIWHCWDWLQHKLKRPLLQGMDCQMEHSSHLWILTTLTYPWSNLWNESEGQGKTHFTFAQLSGALWLNIWQTYEIFFHDLYYKIYFFASVTRKYLFNNVVYNQQERKKGKLLTNLSVSESTSA